MKIPRGSLTVIAALLLVATGVQPAGARLPALEVQPWLAYYAVFANKHFQFGITSQGKIILTPSGTKNDPVRPSLAIPMEITVAEIRPDGSASVRKLQPESLESTQPATAKLEKTVIRGTVTGGASFELILEQNRGVISLGGRLLDPGSRTKNPLRFSLRVKFPSAYPFDRQDDKKEEREFRKKTGDDHLDLTWTDGQRKKQPFDRKLDATAKDLNGPGIAAAEVDISAYKGKRFLFTATPNSSMTLSNNKAAPLHEGFTLHWLPDPAKDPDGKSRLLIEVR